MSSSLGYLQWYATNIYNAVNGIINPTVRSMSLEFITNENDKNNIGESIGNIVLINLPNIINFCDNQGLRDFDSVKGLTMNSVIHELSHIQQDIDFKKYNKDDSYRAFIELTNDGNTLSFIAHNYDILYKNYGSFDMDCVDKLPYKNNMVNDFYKMYTPIQNKQTKLLSLIQSCMQDDINWVINYEKITDMNIHFIGKDNRYKKLYVMVNSMWSNIDNNIFDLSKMLRTGSIYHINVERGKGIFNLIIEEHKKEPIYPVSVLKR